MEKGNLKELRARAIEKIVEEYGGLEKVKASKKRRANILKCKFEVNWGLYAELHNSAMQGDKDLLRDLNDLNADLISYNILTPYDGFEIKDFSIYSEYFKDTGLRFFDRTPTIKLANALGASIRDVEYVY